VPQEGSAYPTIRGPDAVIELKEVRWEFGGYRLTVRCMSLLLLVDLGPSGIPRVFELLPFRIEIGSTSRDGLHVRGKVFPLLHHVQYVILERHLTSGKCRDLMLEALELLGRQSSAGEPTLVASRPRADVVHFGFEPALIRIDIG
jgi:hypothetical protein